MTYILNASALKAALTSITTPGIICTLLCTHEGSIVSSSGTQSTATHYATIASDIWSSYTKASKDINIGSGELFDICVKCEDGWICVYSLGGFLLSITSDSTVETHAIKQRVLLSNF